MKILIKISQSPEQRFLIELTNKRHLKEVRSFLKRGNHSKAMATVLSKGKFLEEVSEEYLLRSSSDIIITKDSARYNLIQSY